MTIEGYSNTELIKLWQELDWRRTNKGPAGLELLKRQLDEQVSAQDYRKLVEKYYFVEQGCWDIARLRPIYDDLADDHPLKLAMEKAWRQSIAQRRKGIKRAKSWLKSHHKVEGKWVNKPKQGPRHTKAKR